MNKAILVIDMPKTCSDCFFCGDIQELSVGNGFYKKIARCLLEKDIEDPWRNLYWQLEHKENWCPLKELPLERDTSGSWTIDGYTEDAFSMGWNSCLEEILGDEL